MAISAAKLELEVTADTRAAESGLKRLASSVTGLGTKFKSIGTVATGALGTFAKVAAGAATVGVIGLGAGIVKAASAGLSFNNTLEMTTAKMVAFTGSQEGAAKVLEMVRERAAKTPFAFNEMADAAAALLPVSKSSGEALEGLIETAEVLAALNPAEGLAGAAFALREATSGDFLSIIERFNLPKQRLMELKEQGVPAIEAVKIAMREMGVDTSLVAGLAETASGRWSTFLDTLQGLAATATAPLFEGLSSGLRTVQQYLDENNASLQEWAAWIGERIGAAFQYLVDTVIPTLGTAFGYLSGTVFPLIREGVSGIYNAVQLLITGDFTGGIFGLAEDHPIINALFLIRQGFGFLYDEINSKVIPAGQWLADKFSTVVLPALSDTWDYISTTLLPKLQELVTAGLDKVREVAGLVADEWNTRFLPAIQTATGYIKDTAIPTMTDLSGRALPAVSNAVKGASDEFNQRWTPALTASALVIGRDVIPITQRLADLQRTTLVQATLAVVNALTGSGGLTQSFGSVGVAAGALISGELSRYDTMMRVTLPQAITVTGVIMRTVLIPAIGEVEGKVIAARLAFDLLVEKVRGLAVEVRVAASALISSAVQIGADMVAGIARGIASSAGSIPGALVGAVQGAIDATKARLRSNSPSLLTRDEIGIPIMQGIGLGLAAGLPAVQASLRRYMGEDLIDAVGDALQAGHVIVGQEGEELANMILEGIRRHPEWGRYVGDDFVHAVASAIRDGKVIAGQEGEELAQWILDGFTTTVAGRYDEFDTTGMGMGSALVGGFVGGVRRGIALARAAVAEMTKEAARYDEFDTTGQGAGEALVGGFLSAVTERIAGAWPTVGEALGDGIGRASAWVSSKAEKRGGAAFGGSSERGSPWGVGESIARGVIGGINHGKPWVTDSMESIATGAGLGEGVAYQGGWTIGSEWVSGVNAAFSMLPIVPPALPAVPRNYSGAFPGTDGGSSGGTLKGGYASPPRNDSFGGSSVSNSITIVQQPGEDPERLANRVVAKIDARNRLARASGG